jgi:hypothetical protein
LASPLVLGQTSSTLLIEGDPVIGIGGMKKVNSIAFTDSRMWVTQIATSFSDASRDGCLLRSGFLAMREGMPLRSAIGDGVLVVFKQTAVSESGDLANVFSVRIGTNSLVDGLYWNLTPLGIKAAPIVANGLGDGSTWDSVKAIRLTPENHLYIIAVVNDTNVAGTKEDSLIRFKISPQGTVTDASVIVTKGQLLDSIGTFVNTIGASAANDVPQSFAVNSQGDFVTIIGGAGRTVIMKNLDTIQAEEQAAAPAPGRIWNSFAASRVALNDRGDVAFSGNLKELASGDQTNFLIVKNGQKFAQSGDSIPALSTAVLAKSTPCMALSNAGDLFWRAAGVQGGAQVDDAFMRNYTPLVQKNKTIVAGNTVQQVNGEDNCFAISREGRFWAGRVEVQGIGTAILFIDFGLVVERNGCRGLNPGKLQRLSGDARLGQQLQLGMTDGPAAGALPILLFSRQGRISATGCGAVTSYGELLIAPPIAKTLLLAPWDGVNPSVLTVPIPNNIALVDATFYAQGVFRSTTQPATFSLTNALQIEIGPP